MSGRCPTSCCVVTPAGSRPIWLAPRQRSITCVVPTALSVRVAGRPVRPARLRGHRAVGAGRGPADPPWSARRWRGKAPHLPPCAPDGERGPGEPGLPAAQLPRLVAGRARARGRAPAVGAARRPPLADRALRAVRVSDPPGDSPPASGRRRRTTSSWNTVRSSSRPPGGRGRRGRSDLVLRAGAPLAPRGACRVARPERRARAARYRGVLGLRRADPLTGSVPTEAGNLTAAVETSSTRGSGGGDRLRESSFS